MSRFKRIDWTGSDFDSLLADLKTRLQTTFPDWTDTSISNEGMALVELVAYVGDLIRYYQDRQVNECFLVTAWERDNIIRHLKMIGYRLSTASAATAQATISIDQVQATSVVFQQGDPCYTADGQIQFEITDKLEIAAGLLSGTVDVIQGETVTEDLGVSDASASQAYTLGQSPFLWASETISVDGVIWTRVDDFLNSASTDQDYTVDVDAFDVATITFGDGTLGAIPADGSAISASYRVGGGAAGNVEAGTITKLGLTYQAADGTPVRASITNAAAATGGADRETEAHAKIYGPKSLATGSRSVSETDFETNAELVAGVSRALAQTVDDDATIDENTVLVQVVPTGSGTPTQTLLDDVTTELVTTKPKTNTTRLMVVPALYTDIALVGTVYVSKGQSGQAVLASKIQSVAAAVVDTALAAFFNADNIDVTSGLHTIDFGALIPLSSLYKVVVDVDDVSRLELTSPTADVVLDKKRFPRLRAYTKAVLTGPDRVEYTWTGLGTKLVVQGEP